jgi:hypothetical protein
MPTLASHPAPAQTRQCQDTTQQVLLEYRLVRQSAACYQSALFRALAAMHEAYAELERANTEEGVEACRPA